MDDLSGLGLRHVGAGSSDSCVCVFCFVKRQDAPGFQGFSCLFYFSLFSAEERGSLTETEDPYWTQTTQRIEILKDSPHCSFVAFSFTDIFASTADRIRKSI